jgi:hypothetical protein
VETTNWGAEEGSGYLNRMKTIRIILLLTIFLFACQNQDTSKCDCSSKSVCVTIKNETNQSINVIILKHEKGEATTKQLTSQNITCLSFESPGENSFNLTAVLNGGDTLKSLEMYSEGGFTYSATIRKDTININHSKY